MDYDLERVTAIARGGLRACHDDESAPENLRLETFVIVAVMTWTDEDGDEVEGTSIWSESRKQHVKVGVLHQGLARIDEEHVGSDD
jgi:hypothetical protein